VDLLDRFSTGHRCHVPFRGRGLQVSARITDLRQRGAGGNGFEVAGSSPSRLKGRDATEPAVVCPRGGQSRFTLRRSRSGK